MKCYTHVVIYWNEQQRPALYSLTFIYLAKNQGYFTSRKSSTSVNTYIQFFFVSLVELKQSKIMCLLLKLVSGCSPRFCCMACKIEPRTLAETIQLFALYTLGELPSYFFIFVITLVHINGHCCWNWFTVDYYN